MKHSDLKNTIEEITIRLHEVGDPILKDADAIRDTMKELNRLEQQRQDTLKLLEKQRQALFAKVQKNYVDSEIETADVLTTRAKD